MRCTLITDQKSSRIMRMRGRTAKQYRNYGELLYREALSKRQNQQKLIAKKLKDDEAKVLAEMTGVPEIRYIIHSVKFLPHLWIETCELQDFPWINHLVTVACSTWHQWMWPNEIPLNLELYMVAMQSKRAKQIRREEGQVWNRLQSEGKLKKDQLQSRTEVCHLLRIVGETSVKHLFLWKHHLAQRHCILQMWMWQLLCCWTCYILQVNICMVSTVWTQERGSN